MKRHAPRLLAAVTLAALAAVLIAWAPGLQASNPRGAYYSADTDKVFWFIQASDTHLGADGAQDYNNLRSLVTTVRNTVNPQFIVVTGDLTDASENSLFGWPTGPSQTEWNEYNAALSGSGISASDYYDLPGNHDAYEDAGFAYYLANSVQGRATGKTQHSWTRNFTYGKYHFLGVNTADNTGNAFSLFWPYGDYAGLDATELSYIDSQLKANADAKLTFVFGHHPVTATGNSQDTYLYYGQEQFVADLDYYRSSSYGYGHTHATSDVQFTGATNTGYMVNGGIRYPNIDSLGKDSPYEYRVFAVDCDGVSSVAQPVGTWPLVMITAPVGKYLGSTTNPYAYKVPNASTNPIRALVFDTNPPTSVTVSIDGVAGGQMAQVPTNPSLWNAVWDASTLSPGEHVIRVTASSASGTRSHEIRVEVTDTDVVNEPPVANADPYNATAGQTLTVDAPGVLGNDTDPEETALTAEKLTNPASGTLTFNSNGSFTYTPTAAGTFTFTYQARDAGGAVSAPATVTLTVTAPPPTTDTVTVTAATWSKRTTLLSVTATSSLQPNVELTVRGYGLMSWNKKKSVYTYSVTESSPPSTVWVDSTGGGSGSRTVRITK